MMMTRTKTQNSNMAKAASSESKPIDCFAFYHTPGPNWVPNHMIWDQPQFQLHVQHLMKYFETRQGILGGPFQDGSGGLAVFEFESMNEARQAALSDPAVQAGILQVKVLPWHIVKTREPSLEASLARD